MKPALRTYQGFTVGLILLAAVSGCPGTSTVTVGPAPVAAVALTPAQDSLCNRGDVQMAQDVGLDGNAVNFVMANGYYGWCIPEYNDDQRLSDGNGGNEYGPVAHVLAAPWLDTLQLNGSFRQVAIIDVDVDTRPTPTPYTDLRLGQFNCLYLRLTSAAPSFDALIVPPIGLICPSTPTPNPAGPPLVVVVDDAFSNDLNDYPPTTRFIEGRQGRTLIGVRCGNRWCAVGPHSAVELQPGGPGGPLPPSAHEGQRGFNYAQARVKGWFDDQVLGAPDGSPKYKIHRQVRASAIPDTSLHTLTVQSFIVAPGSQVYQLVGRTYFPQAPDTLSKYVTTFGFSQGTNIVKARAEIHTNPLTTKPDTLWFAQVINANGHVTSDIKTRRMDHSKFFGTAYGYHRPPSTMRFRWFDNDEDLWFECDVGCCLAGIK